MTLKSNSKFGGKLTYGLKTDIKYSVNFHQRMGKFQNWDFDRVLLSKLENVSA